MKKALFFLFAFTFFCVKGFAQLERQFTLVCEFLAFSQTNDSTFTGPANFPVDQLSYGYLPTQIVSGDRAVDATGRVFRVTGVASATFTSATLTLVEVVDNNIAPIGQGLVYRPYTSPNRQIPIPTSNSTGISPVLLAKLQIHNSEVAAAEGNVYEITNVSDTTSITGGQAGDLFINSTNDTLGAWNGTHWVLFFGGGVTDGDKGDITVSGSGTNWQIDADAVTATEIATGAVGTSEIADGSVSNTDLAIGTGGIYKGSGTLPSDVTVDANSNDLFFENIADFNLIANTPDGSFEIGRINGVTTGTPYYRGMLLSSFFVGEDLTESQYTIGRFSEGTGLNRRFGWNASNITIRNFGAGSTGFQGLVYDADISANFTARSLVDKAYVDALIDGLPGATNLTFTGASTPFTLNSSTGTDVTFAAGTNVTLSRVNNELTISATGTGGGHIIQDNGVTETQRDTLDLQDNLEFEFTVTDNAGGGKTEVKGSLALNGVSLTKLEEIAAEKFIGNPTGSLGNAVEFEAGWGLAWGAGKVFLDTGLVATQADIQLPSPYVRVIVITGQSNALGRALQSAVSSTEIDAEDNIYIWNKGSSAFENLDISSDNNYAVLSGEMGPEYGISKYAAQKWPGEKVYLVKHAVGSTNVEEQLPGGTVYDSVWIYTQRAVNALLGDGVTPSVSLLYMQGENEARAAQIDADSFPSRLIRVFQTWKDNLGADLPILSPQVRGGTVSYDHLTEINDAFNDISSAFSYSRTVDVKNYQKVDGDHYNHQGQDSIGRFVVDALTQMQSYGVAVPDTIPYTRNVNARLYPNNDALNRLVTQDSLTGKFYYVNKSSITTGGGGITGTGSTNYIPKWTSSTAQGSSSFFQDSNGIGYTRSSVNDNLILFGSATKATVGRYNVGIGEDIFSASMSSTTDANIGIGTGILRSINNASADGNVGIGYYVLDALTSGAYNVGAGSEALGGVTTGSGNVGIGVNAVKAVTTTSNNLGIGSNSLSTATGTGNVAIGSEAGRTITAGDYNVGIGNQSIRNLASGSEFSVGIGYQALYQASGARTVGIGTQAGYNSTGTGVFIGNLAGYNETGANKLYIENSNSASPLLGGDFSTNRLGINTAVASLAAALHLTGTGATSSTWGLQVHNSTGTNNALMVRDDGKVAIGTATPGTNSNFTVASSPQITLGANVLESDQSMTGKDTWIWQYNETAGEMQVTDYTKRYCALNEPSVPNDTFNLSTSFKILDNLDSDFVGDFAVSGGVVTFSDRTNYYLVTMSATVSLDAGDKDISLSVFKNNTTETECQGMTYVETANKKYQVSGTTVVQLADTNTLRLKAKVDSGTPIMTVHQLSVSITEI